MPYSSQRDNMYGLSVRSRRALNAAGQRTAHDVTSRRAEDLLGLKHFGETSLQEVRGYLAERGLYLLNEGPSRNEPASGDVIVAAVALEVLEDLDALTKDRMKFLTRLVDNHKVFEAAVALRRELEGCRS